MERFSGATATFEHAIERARQMVALFDALTALRPHEPANDDALRSAYFLAVSSFDFFAHELAAVETKHRFTNGLRTRNIHLPMDVMTIADEEARIATAETHVRQTNSYKAFVDPAKLAELLSCYCLKPWDRLAILINSGLPDIERKSPEHIKGQLKSVWKRRNQIAHEADVNPTLAGVSLWPIDKVDTEITISFICSIGAHMPKVISEPLLDDEVE
ncbi:hypothetical protein [Mesorhizobium onobrychidis]|uniref:RiboL-PSP-HEPN domain-containing protein n=1 Tax=Mesorhizobium onobrychidis TaxID=2775404 RepID=A0ABY5R4V5_9HYPH|nr:hypothetical protein [Mesorhizobium onobrychidis]UVC17876.1 hypothetical protein IHQ72_12715 [Mesorhizobium onobrychidis]